MQLDLDWTDPEVSGNWLEAAVWETCAATLWLKSRGPTTPGRQLARRAAGILVPFGVSDLVESQTGAWWSPWWLLAWKAAGVVGLLACGWALVRMKNRASRPS